MAAGGEISGPKGVPRLRSGGTTVRDAFASAVRAARARPSFALFLIALFLLPWKWLSPLGGVSTRAGWTDVFTAAAVAVWAWEGLRRGARPRLRAPHYALAVYLAVGAASALLASSDRGEGVVNLLLMVELVMLAVLTADYASEPRGRNAVVLVVLVVSLVTFAQAILALLLFYTDVGTSLIGAYGDLPSSSSYARVAAGFYSAPLLGSFCIFAAAVLAREDTDLPRSLLRAGQVCMALVVVLTLSRAIIAFAAAAAIRAAQRRGTRSARAGAAIAVGAAVAAIVVLTAGRLHVNPSRPESTRYVVARPAQNPRLEGLESSVTTFAHNPVLGTGPGSFPGKDRGAPFRPHFTPVNVAATLGAPALAALVLFVVTLWRERRRPTDWATWSGLIGLGIDGIGQDIDHFRHVWVMLGLADAGRRATRD